MKYMVNIILMIILRITHERKPIKDQNAALIDLYVSLLYIYSQINDHIKGHRISHKGHQKSHIIVHIMHHLFHRLVHQNFFVHNIGR